MSATDRTAIAPPPFPEDRGRQAFVPSQYEWRDLSSIADYIAANPVAQVFSVLDGRMDVSAVPLLLVETRRQPDGSPEVVFAGHIARRNRQCTAIAAEAPVLISFFGPGAYVSPRWFRKRKTVPTWNYLALQFRGRFERLSGAHETLQLLERTIEHMESRIETCGGDAPWQLQDADPELARRLPAGITGFRLRCREVDGIARLNQDKDPADRRSIIDALERSSQPDGARVAALMRCPPNRRDTP